MPTEISAIFGVFQAMLKLLKKYGKLNVPLVVEGY